MTYTYEVIKLDLGGEVLKRTDAEGVISWIPMVETNSDYQRYLNPEAEHFTPIVLDEAATK
jgi:hypothetical protein